MQIPKTTIARHIYCQPKSFTPRLSQFPQVTPKAPVITIWIHGTRFFPENVFRNYFYSLPGLHHYQDLATQYHQRRIADTLIASDSTMFPAQTFYLFGWSGQLSFGQREHAAKELYDALKKLRQEYVQKYNIDPYIQILSHSHGGNIALLLEKVKDKADTTFFIDRLILMGTPVQTCNFRYAGTKLFAKVYSLYSILDTLQILDPQGLFNQTKWPFFSARLFPWHINIEQVGIKLNGRSIMHVEFVKINFLQHLSTIITEIDTWKKSSNLKPQEWAKHIKCLDIYTKPYSSSPLFSLDKKTKKFYIFKAKEK